MFFFFFTILSSFLFFFFFFLFFFFLCFFFFFFFLFFFFFFQAEDGIRDRNVTGVQTCALPILYPGLLRILTGLLLYNPLTTLYTTCGWFDDRVQATRPLFDVRSALLDRKSVV